jgi:hypothetical protein
MPDASESPDLSPRPVHAAPLTYFDRPDGTWLPVLRGVVWGSVCYFGLALVRYLTDSEHDIALVFHSNDWAALFEYRFVARAGCALAELLLIVAAVASTGMREAGRRRLAIAATALLVVAPLSEMAAIFFVFNPWWWSRMPDIRVYWVQGICSTAMSAVVPLMLALFLRRPEVRSLFR